MSQNDLTFIPIIPLIGGFPLGAERAMGKPPEFVSSLDGFWKNDSQYMNYQNNTLGRDIEYRTLDPLDRDFKEKVNIVVGTPPCAALSQLNTGKTPESKGSGCAKNDFMYIAAEQAIHCYHADAVIIENAPALFTNKGEGVAKRLTEIAQENGYSISFYKTSTVYHGIPQARDRCFAFLWRRETAPILNWYKRERKTFAEYLKEVEPDAIQQDLIVNPKVANEPYYKFIQHYTGNDNAREEIHAVGKKTANQWVVKKGLMNEALEWFKETNNELGVKLAEHAIYKFSIGKGIWDGSAHIAMDHTQAWIGRNMNDTIHPTEERSCTIRESLHIMGFPHDFELLGGRTNANLIAQNVPVCTAADMVSEAMAVIRGEREDSGMQCFKQNNHNEKFLTPPSLKLNELPV